VQAGMTFRKIIIQKMSRIKSTFDQLSARGERALMPFVTCGDPDMQVTRDLLLAYVEAGADIV
jgi:tryptophan synthase alpha chain